MKFTVFISAQIKRKVNKAVEVEARDERQAMDIASEKFHEEMRDDETIEFEHISAN